MNILKTTALVGLLVGAAAMGCASTQATPLGSLARESMLAQPGDVTSPLILVQNPQHQRGVSGAPQAGRRAAPAQSNFRGGNVRGGHYRGSGYRGGDAGAAAAAGVLGLIIGGAIAAQQQQNLQAGDDAIAYCMQRFRSFNPQTMTYTGFDGLQHPCP